MLARFARILPAVAILAASSAFAADTFKVDPVHSSVVFKASHMKITPFYGVFKDPTGAIVLDKDKPESSSFNVEIAVANIDTRNEKRDQHLKSPDFFNAKEFPTITFKSTAVKADGDKYEVTGDLMVHGVTKSVTVPVEKTGEADLPKMGHRAGFGATFTIKRSDYGMSFMPDALGDEVTLYVGLEAGKE